MDSEQVQLYRQNIKDLFNKITQLNPSALRHYLLNLDKQIKSKANPFLAQFNNLKDLFNKLKEGNNKMAVHFAAARGDLAVFKSLVEQFGCDPFPWDDQDNDPFFTAAFSGNVEIVAYLIDSFKVSVQHKKKGDLTALTVAALQGCLPLFNFLIQRGADVNALSIYGRVINVAVSQWRIQMVKTLLQKGANPDGDSNQQMPAPIFLAIDFNNSQLFDLLMAHKPSLHCRDPSGLTVLHVAAQQQDRNLILQKLISAGADCQAQSGGLTALDYAYTHQNWQAVSILRPITTKPQKFLKQKVQQVEVQQKFQINKQAAASLKVEGNQLFAKGDYYGALAKYKQGLKRDWQNAILLGNMSACYFKLGDFTNALAFGSRSKKADLKYMKGAFRQAQAFFKLKSYAEAGASYWQALQLDSSNAYVRSQLKACVDLGRKSELD